MKTQFATSCKFQPQELCRILTHTELLINLNEHSVAACCKFKLHIVKTVLFSLHYPTCLCVYTINLPFFNHIVNDYQPLFSIFDLFKCFILLPTILKFSQSHCLLSLNKHGACGFFGLSKFHLVFILFVMNVTVPSNVSVIILPAANVGNTAANTIMASIFINKYLLSICRCVQDPPISHVKLWSLTAVWQSPPPANTSLCSGMANGCHF